MKQIFFNSILVFCAACSSPSVSQTPGEHTFEHGMSNGRFNTIIEHFTKKDEQYSGFLAAYQMIATLQNATVLEAQLLRQAEDFKWSRENYFKEKEKSSQELSNESQLFLSYYSPNNDNDKLESGKSIWKVYLVSEGVRYEGKVQKALGVLAQLERLYPHHNRFYTPYIVKFKVPMAKVQQSDSQFIITGPLGTSEVSFPPANSVSF